MKFTGKENPWFFSPEGWVLALPGALGIPLVAEDFLTIVPDHRGTGRSSVPDGPYTIEDHAQDMAGMLRSIGCGPAHIVVSSTGGAIAQVMALDHL